ncbi:MAG: alanine racemase [Gemmatimonadetes bacterium]|nr:alanine racemase [Gemmatimonadota bacterium]MYK98674.1 alanine racemase [Gemmatimonadota bacterium]
MDQDMGSNSIFNDVETPAVLLDETRMMGNLRAMQDLADRHGVSLRPHIKTHKSLEIGRRQIALGASGVTVATVDEAQVFIEGGFESITVARPVVSPGKWDRLLSAEKAHGTDLRVVTDSKEGIQVAGERAAAHEQTARLFLKIDVGLHRCGLLPDDPRVGELAGMIHDHDNLEFRGILSHAGHVYGAKSRAEAAEVAETERRTMVAVHDALQSDGLPVREVSVGATPAVLAAERFDGITEIRPGNYVFLDLLPAHVGVAGVADVALTVLATVISRNERYFVTDAGSKTLTSDTGVHGMTGNQGFGLAYPASGFLEPDSEMIVEKVSEEHGMVGRNGLDLAIGSKIRVVPVHSCPVANLARSYAVLTPDGLETWPVDAAGGSR